MTGTKLLCPKCKRELAREVNKELRKKYPLVCLLCDENFYTFEALPKNVIAK